MAEALPLAGRLRRQWRMKLWLGAALAAGFCGGYFGLQRFPFRPAATLAPSAVDRWVAFAPAWAWAYQSVYPLLAVAAWLAPTRAAVWRYAGGFAAVAVVGFACFAAWPVAGPRPPHGSASGDGAWGAMYRLLARYDGPTNAFPSLHVALAAYTALFAGRALGPGARPAVVAALWAWVAVIGYATLATKQHYFVDLPPGVLLAWAADRLAWRRASAGEA